MSFIYKGLAADLERHIITDEEVERQLIRLQQQTPRIAEITDRAAQLGDEIVLDYAGFCDGVRFPGGTAENQTLVLGSGMFIPGFEEQLVDKVPGEEVTVKVTFPTEYHAEELAGKEAEFHCAIRQIRVKTPYELDDTFAKEVGECDTLDEMRSRMKESLQAYTDERGEMDLQDRLLRQAAETLDFVADEAEIEKALDEQMQTMELQLSQQGLSIDMYCSFMGTTKEALREESRPTAEAALRSSAAIEKIVELEGLDTTEEELAEALAIIARRNNVTMEQLKEHYDSDFEAAVIRSVLAGKAMCLIRDNATITVTEK